MESVTDKSEQGLALGQAGLLEMIASDVPLPETLERLTKFIESQCDGLRCSVLLLDEDRLHLRHGAAPSLPEGYVKAIDGLPIGPRAGSCGTAMYRGTPVIVEDVFADPLWEDYRDLIRPHGLRACWSTPIASSQGRVLGSFAMYYHEPRVPVAAEKRLIGIATHIAGIAIERKQTEEALRQAQKLEAVGRLAGGIAHDFNNILTVIGSACGVAGRNLDRAHPSQAHLAMIANAVERGAGLTRQLLAYSRKQVLAPKIWDLNAIVSGMSGMFGPILGGDIRLAISLAPDLQPVKVDRSQMEQVILNLVVNARDAMPRGGVLTIETANIRLDPKHAGSQLEWSSGPQIMLSVGDTGAGMTRETRSRLFEPFFTTKPAGEGSGLGLSVVHGIVQQSGGRVSVSSEPGKGAVFRVFLPVASQAA